MSERSITFILYPDNAIFSPFSFIEDAYRDGLIEGKCYIELNMIDYISVGNHPKNYNSSEFFINHPINGFQYQGIRFKYSPDVNLPRVVGGDFELEIKYERN